MAGHMGNRRITVKGIEIIHVDVERNLLLLKGGVPGSVNWLLEIRRSRKPALEPVPLVGLNWEAPQSEREELDTKEDESLVAEVEDTASVEPADEESETSES